MNTLKSLNFFTFIFVFFVSLPSAWSNVLQDGALLTVPSPTRSEVESRLKILLHHKLSNKLQEYIHITDHLFLMFSSPAGKKAFMELEPQIQELALNSLSDGSFKQDPEATPEDIRVRLQLIESYFVLSSEKENGLEPIRELPPDIQVRQDLNDVGIAIDPGHSGGREDIFIENQDFEISLSELEDRFFEPEVDIKGVKFEKPFRMVEGELTLQMAEILKDLLHPYGANVFLTRTQNSQLAFESANQATFEQWIRAVFDTTELGKKNRENVLKFRFGEDLTEEQIAQFSKTYFDPEKQFNKDHLKKIFREIYNRFELQTRSNNAEMFFEENKIDLKKRVSLSLHFDYSAPGKGTTYVPFDYHITFGPGGFSNGEFDTSEERKDFFRNLLNQDIVDWKLFAQKMSQQFKQIAHLDPIGSGASEKAGSGWIQNCNPIFEEPGIAPGVGLARNLIVTRCFGAHCPKTFLVESSCQNGMNGETSAFQNLQDPARIAQLARVQLKTILLYFKVLPLKEDLRYFTYQELTENYPVGEISNYFQFLASNPRNPFSAADVPLMSPEEFKALLGEGAHALPPTEEASATPVEKANADQKAVNSKEKASAVPVKAKEKKRPVAEFSKSKKKK